MVSLGFWLPMNGQRRSGKFDKVTGLKRRHDGSDVRNEEALQIGVANVARRNEPQLVWFSLERHGIDEILVFRDDNILFTHRYFDDLTICRAIVVRQFFRVNRIVPGVAQAVCQAPRQLSIDEEFHTATALMDFVRASRAA